MNSHAAAPLSIGEILDDRDAAADRARGALGLLHFLAGFGQDQFAGMCDAAVILGGDEAVVAAEFAAIARRRP